MEKISRKGKIILLSGFLCIVLGKFLYSLIYSPENQKMLIISGLSLIFYCIISYYVYKNNKIATWVMSFIIFVSGASSLCIGLFILSLKQIGLKLLFVLLGAIFCYGSFRLYSSFYNGGARSTMGQRGRTEVNDCAGQGDIHK